MTQPTKEVQVAKKEALIIGGYKVPGGHGGAAVLKACELVRSQPGIKQGELLETVTRWAGLNLSTASWITSPGSKSPSGILWDRRKEGRAYHCYPNVHTLAAPDPREAMKRIVQAEIGKNWGGATKPVPGGLAAFVEYQGYNQPPVLRTGLLMELDVTWRDGTRAPFESWEVMEDLSYYDRGSLFLHAHVVSGNRKSIHLFRDLHPVGP